MDFDKSKPLLNIEQNEKVLYPAIIPLKRLVYIESNKMNLHYLSDQF